MMTEIRHDEDPYVEYRTKFILDVLQRHGLSRFDSVIDFGCGKGRVFESLVNHLGAGRAVGLDFRAPAERGSIGIEYIRTNFFDYEPQQPFDLVTSIQVFEHIYEPWLGKYFAAIKRCCGDRGTILISTPNRWRPSNLVRAMTLRGPRMMNPNPGIPPEQHLGHHRESSYRELSEILGRFFPGQEWNIKIVRPIPRLVGLPGFRSSVRWAVNLAVYGLLWPAWRPLCVSCSHDHYAVIQRSSTC